LIRSTLSISTPCVSTETINSTKTSGKRMIFCRPIIALQIIYTMRLQFLQGISDENN
jgi:hypothetical protein